MFLELIIIEYIFIEIKKKLIYSSYSAMYDHHIKIVNWLNVPTKLFFSMYIQQAIKRE